MEWKVWECTVFPLPDTLSVGKFTFEDLKTLCHYLKSYLHSYVQCSIIYNSRDMETT